jgi:hypothetical protein
MRGLLNSGAGITALAIACRFLLPSRVLLAFTYGGIARGVGINRVAFWLVLGIGPIWLLVRLVKFFAAK